MGGCLSKSEAKDKTGKSDTGSKLVKSLQLDNKVTGVTQLGDTVYAVCCRSSVIKMFTADTLSPVGEGIDVKEITETRHDDYTTTDTISMKEPRDIVASHHDRQLYVAEFTGNIWRVSVSDGEHTYVKWLTDLGNITSVSVTSSHLLVVLDDRTVRQYSVTDGQLVRELPLPSYMTSVRHAVETSRDTIVVCHRGTSSESEQNAVSEVDADGKELCSFTDAKNPYYLSIDSEGRVLIADYYNSHIPLLNGKLELQRILVDDKTSEVKLWHPERFSYNEVTSTLCVQHGSSEDMSSRDVISLFSVQLSD